MVLEGTTPHLSEEAKTSAQAEGSRVTDVAADLAFHLALGGLVESEGTLGLLSRRTRTGNKFLRRKQPPA